MGQASRFPEIVMALSRNSSGLLTINVNTRRISCGFRIMTVIIDVLIALPLSTKGVMIPTAAVASEILIPNGSEAHPRFASP